LKNNLVNNRALLANGLPVAIEVKNAEFIFGAPSLTAIRRQPLPEIAIIGRSNVGKSTFLNRMCKRKIARVSGNPGSTRELNFYLVEGQRSETETFGIALVDMPGFGFAKLSKVERDQISRLAVSYLRQRQQIRAVILLNDCRRTPGEDELAVQALCAQEGIHCLIVITKIDALRSSEKTRSVREIAKAYGLEESDVLVTGDGVSPEPVWNRLLPLLSL
jgi:GTP-binding protein